MTWDEWCEELLRYVKEVTAQYPNLDFLPKNREEIEDAASYLQAYKDGDAPQDAIDTEISYAMQDSG